MDATGPLRPLRTRTALYDARPGDLLLRQIAVRWAADLPAYALGEAVALHHGWGGEDLVVVGDPGDALALVRAMRAEGTVHGREISAPRPTVARLVAEDGLPEHEGWAYRWTDAVPMLPVAGAVGWVANEDEVSAVLAAGFPDASKPVGHPDVRRWAGLRRAGRLVAVAADATAEDGLAFVASIATDPAARGTGAGTAVTAWLTAELVREHARCGLWHFADNVVAGALYTRLGYRDEHQMGVAGQEHAAAR